MEFRIYRTLSSVTGIMGETALTMLKQKGKCMLIVSKPYFERTDWPILAVQSALDVSLHAESTFF